MALRQALKKLCFSFSPVYRHTTYLLQYAERLETAQHAALEMTAQLAARQTERMREEIECQTEQMREEIAQQNELMREETALREEVRHLSARVEEALPHDQDRFTGHYEYWRAKRVTAIVEHYGEEWFRGKKILELGCGYGDIGHVLMTLGAQITFAEGRAENCDVLRRRFPQSSVYCMNCENEWPFAADAHFDLVLHMGLLYHLDNLWFALDKASACCDYLVLETEVADSDDENYIIKTQEDAAFWDQSLIGHGSRPSAPYVERHLRDLGWRFQRVTDARCNAQIHTYDWPVKNTGTWKHGQRRFWFCEKGGE